jgi:DNA repair protein RadC
MNVVQEALGYLEQKYKRGIKFETPIAAADYFRVRLGLLEYESFNCAYLDNRHALVSCEEMFRGTINGCSVHPREIVKRALQLNAAAVICAHNHPSGVPEPSNADKAITTRLVNVLNLVDVRLLDHFVVGGSEYFSFSERGLI